MIVASLSSSAPSYLVLAVTSHRGQNPLRSASARKVFTIPWQVVASADPRACRARMAALGGTTREP